MTFGSSGIGAVVALAKMMARIQSHCNDTLIESPKSPFSGRHKKGVQNPRLVSWDCGRLIGLQSSRHWKPGFAKRLVLSSSGERTLEVNA